MTGGSTMVGSERKSFREDIVDVELTVAYGAALTGNFPRVLAVDLANEPLALGFKVDAGAAVNTL